MNRVVILCCLLALLIPGTVQAGSIFSGHVDTSGYIQPIYKASEFMGSQESFLGARGGVTFDHKLMFGASIYTLVSDVPITTREDSLRLVKFTYGGLEIEYTFWTNSVIHPTLSTLIGIGGIKYRDPVQGSFYDPDSDTVFVAEPMLALEINLTDFARLTVGGGYRLVTGVDLVELSNSDAEGWVVNLGFKLGAF